MYLQVYKQKPLKRPFSLLALKLMHMYTKPVKFISFFINNSSDNCSYGRNYALMSATKQ